MTKKEFKKYKKAYGKKVDSWPVDLNTKADAYSYLSTHHATLSIVFASIAVLAQIVSLIARILANMHS